RWAGTFAAIRRSLIRFATDCASNSKPSGGNGSGLMVSMIPSPHLPVGPRIFPWGRGCPAAGAYAPSARQKGDVNMYLCLQRGNAEGAHRGKRLPDAAHAIHSRGDIPL